MKKQLTAIGWARVSTPTQWNDGDHIVQANKIDKWCEENNVRCNNMFRAMYNKHETPYGIRKRPHMNQLIVEIKVLSEMGMQPDMVVAIELARYGNEDIILNVLLPFFDGRDVAIVAIREGVNSITDREAFVQAVHDAEITKKDKKRTAATQKDRKEKYRVKREAGIKKAGSTYGYEYDPKKQLYSREVFSSGIVELIFVLYVYYHLTLDEICSKLTRENVKPLKAKEWGKSSVRAILKNQCYYTGKTDGGFSCDKIVDEYTWQRANVKLRFRTGGRSKSEFRDIVRCGKCSETMSRKGHSYGCGKCKRNITEVEFIEKVSVVVRKQINDMLIRVLGNVSEVFVKAERITDVLCDMKAEAEGSMSERVRMIRNFVPCELGRYVKVYDDRVEVSGIRDDEIAMLLPVQM